MFSHRGDLFKTIYNISKLLMVIILIIMVSRTLDISAFTQSNQSTMVRDSSSVIQRLTQSDSDKTGDSVNTSTTNSIEDIIRREKDVVLIEGDEVSVSEDNTNKETHANNVEGITDNDVVDQNLIAGDIEHELRQSTKSLSITSAITKADDIGLVHINNVHSEDGDADLPQGLNGLDTSYEKEGSFERRYATEDDLPTVYTSTVSCNAVVKGDAGEIEKAKLAQHIIKQNPIKADTDLLALTQNCGKFISNRKYLMHPVNKEEEEFPIAFSIIMYKEPFMVERLLRAIYRPQNVYCIHVDLTSSLLVYETMKHIATCFDNVFIASERIDVKWGWFSVVKPELACLKDLLQHPIQWKYFVNLCGQEFPIKTNLELVRVLKAYNGANDVQGRYYKIVPQVMQRVKYGFKYESVSAPKYLKQPFPYNITWAKGSVHVAVTRGFADFFINNKIGQDFVDYINDTSHGSEHLWNPINFSPQLGAPGSYTGFPDIKHDPVEGLTMIRYKIWAATHRSYPQYRCNGIFSRQICIVGLGDLVQMVNSGRLFVNKFHSDFHPLAYDCLEEHVWNSTRLDILGVDRLNISFYENLDFVKNHI